MIIYVESIFEEYFLLNGNVKIIKTRVKSLIKVLNQKVRFKSNLHSQPQNLFKSAPWFCFKIKFLKIFSTIFVFVYIRKASFYTYYFFSVTTDQ